jgi:hypothetical protein
MGFQNQEVFRSLNKSMYNILLSIIRNYILVPQQFYYYF